MKIVVSYLPFFDSDCMFFRHGDCQFGDECEITNECGGQCSYLTTIEKEKLDKQD